MRLQLFHCCCSCLCSPTMLTRCTTKRVLNEDQYAESGCPVFFVFSVVSGLQYEHTRLYENGHATNGFA